MCDGKGNVVSLKVSRKDPADLKGASCAEDSAKSVKQALGDDIILPESFRVVRRPHRYPVGTRGQSKRTSSPRIRRATATSRDGRAVI